MGLSLHLLERARYRLADWNWRVRYWWLDTESGAQAHAVAFVLSLLSLAYQMVRLALAALLPRPEGQQHAIIWWVAYIIVAVVSAVISYALRPKMPKQADPDHKGPTVDDGLCVDDRFGTVEVNQPHMLAWKVVRKEKIRAKAGKK
ncbi:MAG: hypothetical protein WA956_05555 [Stenotrophomonas sp.]